MRASLFSPEGRLALDRMMASRHPLLAFDFDGTLAPIVARPDDARLPMPVVRRLKVLSACLPVAILTGRSVSDVTARMAFVAQHIVGNHGAEDAAHTARPNPWSAALDPMRRVLRAANAQLSACGVTVEDKGPSMALHYRLAGNRAVALAAINSVLRGFDTELKISHGNAVVNLLAQGAPDKGDALRAVVERIGADAGLFVGDDNNDEPAFQKLDPSWVTVRMGPLHVQSRAAFSLDGPSQMPLLLQHLIDAARSSRPCRG